jgi:hypothetical protein
MSGPVDQSLHAYARDPARAAGAALRLPPDVGNFFFADSFLAVRGDDGVRAVGANAADVGFAWSGRRRAS